MEVILKLSAREALDSIEAGLIGPLLRLNTGAPEKKEEEAPKQVDCGWAAPEPAPTEPKPMTMTTTPAVVTGPEPIAPMPAVPVTPTAPEPVPAAAPAPITQTVPTETHAYTRDDLARAAAGLMDAGRIADLKALLQSFGVDSLVALPENQYGAFATQMRSLGAEI